MLEPLSQIYAARACVCGEQGGGGRVLWWQDAVVAGCWWNELCIEQTADFFVHCCPVRTSNLWKVESGQRAEQGKDSCKVEQGKDSCNGLVAARWWYNGNTSQQAPCHLNRRRVILEQKFQGAPWCCSIRWAPKGFQIIQYRWFHTAQQHSNERRSERTGGGKKKTG